MTKSNIKKLFFSIYMLRGKCNLVEKNDQDFCQKFEKKSLKKLCDLS